MIWGFLIGCYRFCDLIFVEKHFKFIKIVNFNCKNQFNNVKIMHFGFFLICNFTENNLYQTGRMERTGIVILLFIALINFM
jgi:hypothetical protein